MGYKIQIKSCLKVNLPKLDVGEFALCTDSNELFIGSDLGNIQISNIEMIGLLSTLSTQNKTNITAAINEIHQNLIDLTEKEINIEDSKKNGNIIVNGSEIIVYDESEILEQLNTKANSNDLENKANLDHQHTLNDINEISISDLREGYTLQYDSTIQKFSAKPLSFSEMELKQLKDVRYPTDIPNNGNVLTYNQGFWEPKDIEPQKNTASGSYLIELNRWGIRNDKTAPKETVDGINNAFKWAFENGYKNIVFPKGNYLISQNKSIYPQNNTHYDFGGSRIFIEPNNKERYSIVSIGSSDSTKKAHHITITNGEFIGDRYDHDFSSGGTHEWGHCISLKGHCKFIKIANCILRDAIGDGYIGEGNYDVWLYPNESNFELGTINKTSGVKESSINKVRTISPYDVSHFRVTNNENKFMLTGNGYGTLRGINTDIFDLFFYDENGNFIGHKENTSWYEDIERPNGAKTMHIVLHQNTATNISFEVRAEPRPEFITIENCEIMNNRRVGIVGAGTRNFYIRNNRIHHNSGYVGAGIDIEDGYRTNQNIYIDGNEFFGHGINDVILVGTYYASVTNNSFQSNCGGSGKYWLLHGNKFLNAGASIRANDVLFTNNMIKNTTLNFGYNSNGKNIIISSCVFHNSRIIMNQPEPHSINLFSCSFFNNSDKYLSGTISSYNNPCIIKNVSIIGKESSGATLIATDDSVVKDSIFIYPVFSGSYLFKFENCEISYPSIMTTTTSSSNKTLCFEKCSFTTNDRFLVFNSPNSNLNIMNCKITVVGTNANFINIINAKNIFVQENHFSSTMADSGAFISSSGVNTAFTKIKNNIFEGNSLVVKPIDFSWKLIVNPTIYENNVIKGISEIQLITGDTHKIGPSYIRPQKKLELGTTFFDTTLRKPIWVNEVKSGYYTNEISKRNSLYKLGQLIYENGKIFECTKGGTTSTLKPNFPTGVGEEVIDGTVKWTCRGDRAIWLDYLGNTVE
ncbi:right-handed parallel beta-helix repeat-containing protein [Bacillus sp. RO2]|uniref:right-handed parallel beta-helix repeat-containing protein n=1 Tax=Bacillus sp. RO2 TaxID=2723913 RepID=UPI00145F2E0D|nr:right-handed parallel beta-helix repeat-containing protein [Bacillus sp. RO2]NMH75302.1 right-handed parallel beta-helix repeat-containing protein [Bacillus sp. RO2]